MQQCMNCITVIMGNTHGIHCKDDDHSWSTSVESVSGIFDITLHTLQFTKFLSHWLTKNIYLLSLIYVFSMVLCTCIIFSFFYLVHVYFAYTMTFNVLNNFKYFITSFFSWNIFFHFLKLILFLIPYHLTFYIQVLFIF